MSPAFAGEHRSRRSYRPAAVHGVHRTVIPVCPLRSRVLRSRDVWQCRTAAAIMSVLMTSGADLPSKTSTKPEFRVILPSRPENVAVIRQALAGAIEVLGLTESRLLDINTAVSEACNNVVVHGYEGEPGPLEVFLCVQGSELEVVVRDDGVGIRPRAPEPGLEVQGLGLLLIQTLSDRVEFLGGVNQGTEVRMAFSLNGQSDAGVRETTPAVDVRHPPGELVIGVTAGA